jgi:hypothetical protein
MNTDWISPGVAVLAEGKSSRAYLMPSRSTPIKASFRFR